MSIAVLPHEGLIPQGSKSLQETQRGAILPLQEENARRVSMGPAAGHPFDALPTEFLFGALRHPALKLLNPIPLRTERTSKGVSVVWDAVQEFGFGDTFSEAVEDFGGTISELYIDLTSNEHVLSDDLQQVRDVLIGYIDVLEER